MIDHIYRFSREKILTSNVLSNNRISIMKICLLQDNIKLFCNVFVRKITEIGIVSGKIISNISNIEVLYFNHPVT